MRERRKRELQRNNRSKNLRKPRKKQYNKNGILISSDRLPSWKMRDEKED